MKKSNSVLSGLQTCTSNVTDWVIRHKFIVAPAALILLAAVPFVVTSQYVLRVMCLIGIYSILTMSLNLITGYMGQSSMGHAALYMMGAYFSGLLGSKLGWPFWVTLPFGIVGGAIGGLILGVSTMKLSASYLTVITLAFGEVVEMVVLNWNNVTNGPLGVRGIPRPEIFGWQLTTANGGFYWLMLVLVVLTIVVCTNVVNSKFGRAVRAIKEDELAAKLMGINTASYRVQTIVLSGAIAGVVGFLLVSGANNTLYSGVAAGAGFTAITVAWLAQLNPFAMVGISALLAILQKGADTLNTQMGVPASLSDVITGVLLFFMLGCEFFINYKLVFRGAEERHKRKEAAK